jgi:hypothetical protein
MRHRMALLATTAVVIAGGGAVGGSYAAVTAITEPNASGAITSCFNTTDGAVRMVNASATCATGEKKLTWASNIKPKVHLVGAAGEPAYQSNWKAFSSPPFGNASFFKDSAGVVHLTGIACLQDSQIPTICGGGTLGAGIVPIFTLPPGFRPTNQLLFTTLSFGQPNYQHTRIDITTAGVVELTAPPYAGMDWVSFDGISFLP